MSAARSARAETRPTRLRRVPTKAGLRYINRELSWLDWNARVLYQAQDPRNPLLERVKFLAIFASNLDEFFQVRVSGLRQQSFSRSARESPDGLSAARQLELIRPLVRHLIAEHSAAFADIRKALVDQGIAIVKYNKIPEHHARLRERFIDEIFPVLTPLAVDPGHPFPYISTLSLSIAVGLRDPDTGERRFARVKVPPILPRLIEAEPNTWVLLDQVIANNLDLLFTGMEITDDPPVPGDPQRRPGDRGGRGRRPDPGDRGGAPSAALRRGRPTRGRAEHAGRDLARSCSTGSA